ncbi:MAG: Asp-tRNA(Asn)/Glu-tRNA(Gln) amidotransferase subunit GatB [Thermoproteota archaeon]|nr:Asp-tRNA(Asn)/Glu-tRNA(Gln) amidotransferase subunit GatB [Thermoproteota archaeon]
MDSQDMIQNNSKIQQLEGNKLDNNYSINENIKIGLEIHCQLTSLKTKLFCDCFSDYRDIKPNRNTCSICLGLPGSMPLLNKKAVEYASMMCISLNCIIPEKITFYRKNYFYPDLPKNFQITQYNSYELSSIGYDGFLPYSDSYNDNQKEKQDEKIVRIKRIQLEEDPGKIIYEDNNLKITNYCLIDYNRAGVALVEIVTEPDFQNATDVRLFLNKITNIFEYLGVSDPNLEGAVRCDVNVSIKGGKKVEIKNISSFKDVEKSIFYEITRQKTLSIHEISIKSETRHWDEKRKITISARAKEEEDEYKYFPEPDIPRIILGSNFKEKIKEKMPELPIERLKRYKDIHNLSNHISNILINNKKVSDFYEESLKLYNSPKEISNWIINELLSKIKDSEGEDEEYNNTRFNKNRVFNMMATPQQIADIVKLVEETSINRNSAKDIFNKSIKTGESPLKLIKAIKIEKILDPEVIIMQIDEVLKNEKHLIEKSNTNPNISNFILGKIMKKTNGRADPQLTLKLIKELLQKEKIY